MSTMLIQKRGKKEWKKDWKLDDVTSFGAKRKCDGFEKVNFQKCLVIQYYLI